MGDLRFIRLVGVLRGGSPPDNRSKTSDRDDKETPWLIRAVVSSCVTVCWASLPYRLVLAFCRRVLLLRNCRVWIRPLLPLRRLTTSKWPAMRVTIPLMKRANSALTACSSMQTPKVASSSQKTALHRKAGANRGRPKRKQPPRCKQTLGYCDIHDPAPCAGSLLLASPFALFLYRPVITAGDFPIFHGYQVYREAP